MHGGRDYRLPSRFLGEIPADALAEPPGGPAAGAADLGGRGDGRAGAGRGVRDGRLGAPRDVRRGRGHGDRRGRGPGAGALRAGRLRAAADGRRGADEEGAADAGEDHRRQAGRGGAARGGPAGASTRSGIAYGRVPGLVGIQVGDDPASELYQAGKARAAEEAGMISRRVVLPDTTTQAELDDADRRPERRRRGQRDAGAAPGARPAVRGGDREPHPPRQGRGRVRADQPGAPDPRRAGVGALHAGGRDVGARPRRDPARGRQRRGGGPQPDRRQAHGAAAHGAERHGHRRPLQARATCRSCAAAPTCWWPPSAGPR